MGQHLRDLNLNPVPSILTFRADVNRQFGAYRSRNIDGPKGALPETYNKYFYVRPIIRIAMGSHPFAEC